MSVRALTLDLVVRYGFQVLGALLGPETREVDMTSVVAPGSREVRSESARA